MICWFKYPFIRLLIPFAIGIWFAFYLRIFCFSEKYVIYLLIILLVLLTFLVATSVLIKNYRFRYIFSLLLNAFLFLLGFSFVRLHDYKLCVNDLSDIDFVPKYYVARLCECPTIKDKSVKVMMELLEIKDASGDGHRFKTKIIAYFEKEDNSMSLSYGDCIVFVTNPEEVKKPPNPEQFDYKEYLYKKGVQFQVYLKSDKWLDLGYKKYNPIYRLSYGMRDFLLLTMQRLGVEEDEYAVAAAILLGFDDSLTDDLRHKYVAAGAMHVLCVSGLHVGVVFVVFSYLLVLLDDKKKIQALLKHITLLLLIWLYALMAGLSPSVLRSTIMLSFVIVGDVINRKGVMLNSLAASAVILLCINPADLFDVGFLLSYVAVIGIVILQKPISKLIYSKYKIVNKLWEITSVTIAAQIATAPFTIYYFHQFPIYFWLSNLFMTPISSIVIIGGTIMLLVSFIPYINVFVAFLFSKTIYVMNFIVSWIESLPFSIIKGLYIDEIQFVILLLLLLSFLLFVELKEKNAFFDQKIFNIVRKSRFIIKKSTIRQKNMLSSIDKINDSCIIYGINHHLFLIFLL